MFPRRIMRCNAAVGLAVVVLACANVFAVPSLYAQGTAADTGAKRGGRGGGAYQGPSRAMIEEFQKRYERILREQVTFTDDQIVKWRAWNARFDAERRPLFAEEREIRRTLRMQLAKGVTPDEAKVVDATDRWAKLQRKRLELKERENKALAAFLTPIQRARFFAFQDEAERIFREADGRRDGGRGDIPGGRGGPPQTRGNDTLNKFRPGMRGDSASGKFPRQGGRGAKVDTLSLFKPGN